MKTGEGRKQFKELMVILGTGVGGVALFVVGLKACEGGFNLFGALLAVAGGCLVLFAGYYHYRKDYEEAEGKGGLVAFLALTAFCALAGMVAVRLLLGG
ncbi:MAG: hypothetical protein KKE79_02090 [Actinobacteria bacterium]|nr:hypothetical protein [Actinomycetota bacterium]MBU4489405.1 hypothetical protein [Actinomycetota bacterium]